MVQNSRLFGSIFIVAGTSIGASMLVLPIAASSLGAIVSISLLIIMWMLGYYSATLVLDAHIFYKESYSVPDLCKKTFNNKTWLIADFSIFILFYSLLSGYLSAIFSMAESICIFDYAGLVIASLLIFLVIYSPKVLDMSNRIIFFSKFVFFGILLYFLSYKVEIVNLKTFAKSYTSSSLLLEAIPLFFTSFGFHGSIPFISKYLSCDYKLVKKSFFYGSTISLLVYMLWIIACLGVLPSTGINSFESINNNQNKLCNFISLLTKVTENKFLYDIVSIFNWLAIVTSFLGVGVGLYDYVFCKLKFFRNGILENRILAVIITFIPPIILSIFYINIFMSALAFAAISLSLIAALMPALISFKIGNRNRFVVTMVFLGSVVIIFTEIFNLLFSIK